MNKLLSTLLFLIFYSCNTAYAQDRQAYIGFEIGPSMGFIHGQLEEQLVGETEAGFGIHAGIFAQYFQNESFSLHLGLYFTQKPLQSIWIEITPTGRELRLPSTLTYNFIQLPLNARYYLGKQKSYYIELGAFLSFVLNHPSRRIGGGNSIDIEEQFDLGMKFGMGKKFSFKNKKSLEIGFSLDMGLRDANQFSTFRISTNPFQTRAILLGIAYAWPIRN